MSRTLLEDRLQHLEKPEYLGQLCNHTDKDAGIPDAIQVLEYLNAHAESIAFVTADCEIFFSREQTEVGEPYWEYHKIHPLQIPNLDRAAYFRDGSIIVRGRIRDFIDGDYDAVLKPDGKSWVRA